MTFTIYSQMTLSVIVALTIFVHCRNCCTVSLQHPVICSVFINRHTCVSNRGIIEFHSFQTLLQNEFPVSRNIFFVLFFNVREALTGSLVIAILVSFMHFRNFFTTRLLYTEFFYSFVFMGAKRHTYVNDHTPDVSMLPYNGTLLFNDFLHSDSTNFDIYKFKKIQNGNIPPFVYQVQCIINVNKQLRSRQFVDF